jgi:hypothetical protein
MYMKIIGQIRFSALNFSFTNKPIHSLKAIQGIMTSIFRREKKFVRPFFRKFYF